MHWYYPCLLALLSASSSLGQDTTATASISATAVFRVPTIATDSATTSQATFDPPPEEDMTVTIGTDSQYLTSEVTGSTTNTRWIADSSDFGTTTVTTTGTDGVATETAIPKGFRVSHDEEGDIVITFSKYIKDQLAALESSVPVCGTKIKRWWDAKRRQYRQKRQMDPSCYALRPEAWVNNILQKPELMYQAQFLSDEFGYTTGMDIPGMAREGKMVTFIDQEKSKAINYAAMDSTKDGGKAMEYANSTAVITASALGYYLGAESTLDNVWKFKANPVLVMKVEADPTGSTKTEESHECPKDETTLACEGVRCMGDETSRCTREFQGCRCLPSSDSKGDFFFFEGNADVVEAIMAQLKLAKDVPDAKCSAKDDDGADNLSAVDTDTWSKVLDAFCEDKGYLSNNSFNISKKASDYKIDGYGDWTYYFMLDVANNEDCSGYSCDDVYGKFKKCSYDSHTTFKSGKLTLECGTASYRMTDAKDNLPKAPLTLHSDYCFGSDDFGTHFDVHRSNVERYASVACKSKSDKPIVAGDPDSFIRDTSIAFGVPYHYEVRWREGCMLESGKTEVKASNPFDESDPGDNKCRDILSGNYDRCNNGGVGGTINAGCLTYEFSLKRN